MQTHVDALIVVIVNIGCTRVAVCEGPWCYDCDKAVKPGSCGEIIKCKDDEQCYASSTGVSPTQYTAGCRKKQLYQGTGSVAGASSPHGCEECCIGAHCNSKLCGGLPVPMGGSRLCLQCEAVRHPSQCSTVSKCGQDKYCSIWKRYKFQMTFYDLGCLEKTECDGHMKGEDQLSYGGVICCNDDFCNSHENNNHLTPAPTETAATTSQPETTIRTGNLLCKTCASIQQPSFCQSETQCGPYQECEDHMTTLGEGGFRCCNEDRCNANVNPVTGTATPTITIPASPETSSVPTTTSSLPPSTTIRTGTLICKTCEIVQQPTFCQRETECGPEQYCSVRRVFKFGIIFYELGCEEKTACEDHMTTLGEAGFRCCNEDRCNANVNPKKPSSLTPMAPDIMNTNQTVNVIAGKTVLLLCNVTGNPEPSVTWTYDKQVSPNAHPKGSTLAISSVNEKNEGQYRCVANNALGTMEGIIHLHVIEPVFVKVEPPMVVISPGMSGVRLKCVGEGIPAPKATLSRLGGDITADKFYGHVNPAEILLVKITEANMLTYDGVYVCNATNGHTSASAYQIVAGNITRMLGENIAFNNISTTPLKAFHALCPPGQPQTDASPTATEFDLGALICTSARKVGLIDTDAGSVTWLIRPDGKAQFLNGSMSVDLEQVNTSTTPASLVSSATTSSPLLAPDILNTNQTVNAILGETVLLFCNVSGNPTPSVTWEYDKSENRNAHPKGSTLAISSVNEKNKGIYRCVANNTQGTKEGIVNLHVIEPVSVKGEPPIVVISPGMRIVRLKCVGEGIPPPSITLSKYGEDITADKSYRYLGLAEILIMGITEANVLKYDGVYVCNATNGHTSASAYQIVASNVTRTLWENVTFNNVSTTPLKAFHALCPPGLTGPDGSPVTHEFNLDEAICTSARMVGLIDNNPGLVTWLIRADGKAQFLNGSLNVDIGQANSTSVITTPSTSASSSAQVSSTESTTLPLSLSIQPSTVSNIQNTAFSHTVNSLEYNTFMATPSSYATHVPLASILAPSNHVITSHSSEAVTSSSQSLFLPLTHTPPGSSHIVSITDMLSVPYRSTSLSHTLDITSFSSNVVAPSQASAAKLEVSSSQYMSGYPSLVVTSFLPSTISLSSPASTSMHVSPLSTSASQVMTASSSTLISSHASAGTLDSSKATSSSESMPSSASPSLAIISLLPLSLTSHSITDTDASSGRMTASDIVSSSASPTLEMSTIPSSIILSSHVGAGTYASSVGMSSSVSASSSATFSFVVTGLPSGMVSSQVHNRTSSMTMSSSTSSLASSISISVVLHSSTVSSAQVTAGEYSSSKDPSSLELQSSTALPTLSMTAIASSMTSSAQESAGEYFSSMDASSLELQSSSASTFSISPVPSSMTSSQHANAGTYASTRAASSSESYPSSLLAVFSTTTVASSTISSSQASASNFASSIGMSSSVSASSSGSYISAKVALHSILMSSVQAGPGEYSSSREASSLEVQSTSESPSPSNTAFSSSIISSSQVSAGTYTSSRGVSAFALVSSSASPPLEMSTISSSIILSSQVGAGTYASSVGVSSSVSASSSATHSFAVTGLPSSMISSQNNAGTASKGMSSSVYASSSASSISASAAFHSIMTSSAQASTGEYSSSVDSSSLELQSRSALPTSSMKVNAGEYSSSMDSSSLELQSSSASLPISMTAVPSSMISSVPASTKAYSSSMEASSSDQQLISASPTLSMAAVPSGMASSSHASAGAFASSRVMLFASVSSSPSPTSAYVTSSSVSLVVNPLPSQSSVSQILSSGHTESPFALNSISVTSHLPNKTITLTSLSAAIATSPQPTAITIVSSAPALLSDIVSRSLSYVISPSSSVLSPGQSSAIPGTYKQEPTTEGTTAATTVPDVAPYISNPSQKLNGHFGENVILTCDVGGFPEPSVSWFYDQKKIFNAYAVDNNLTLTYVTKDNTGDYTCVAVNSVGAANGTIHFKIYNPITVKNPVVILDTDNPINQLECAAKGDPVPKITWTKYGGGLDISTDYSISAFEDGDLLLTGLSKANLHTYQGIYICHADNGAKDAYVVAAGNITQTQDNSQTFNDVGMNVGAAFHAMCVPGTVDADGSSLSTTFGANDSICDSARRVGVLAKDAGPVTWFIRTDGKAEFVTEAEGGAFSVDDVPTAQDAPIPQLPSTITAVKAPLSCETCSGPTCGMLPGPDTQCPRMTPFCMNTITTRTGGSKSVTKSCASVNDCETKWWQLTSDESKCMTPVPGNQDSGDVTCSYCCTESGCNKDGVPKKDTLYKGNTVHS